MKKTFKLFFEKNFHRTNIRLMPYSEKETGKEKFNASSGSMDPPDLWKCLYDQRKKNRKECKKIMKKLAAPAKEK